MKKPMYDFDLPEGMSPAEFGSHPVRQAIRSAAYFGKREIPSAHELERLELSSNDRGKVERACRRVAAVHDDGDHQTAWGDGDEAAAGIIAGLPDELRDPDYLKQPDPLADTDDPDELAARVSRHGLTTLPGK